MIESGKLTCPTSSSSYRFLICVVRTPEIYGLSKLQVSITVLLTIVTVVWIASLESMHPTQRNLCTLWPASPRSPHLPSLWQLWFSLLLSWIWLKKKNPIYGICPYVQLISLKIMHLGSYLKTVRSATIKIRVRQRVTLSKLGFYNKGGHMAWLVAAVVGIDLTISCLCSRLEASVGQSNLHTIKVNIC